MVSMLVLLRYDLCPERVSMASGHSGGSPKLFPSAAMMPAAAKVYAHLSRRHRL